MSDKPEALLIESMKYERAKAQRYFDLYNEVCETARHRLQVIAQLDTDLHRLHAEKEALQAKIDALMLEYCPQDMSVEQIVNWSNNQRKEQA